MVGGRQLITQQSLLNSNLVIFLVKEPKEYEPIEDPKIKVKIQLEKRKKRFLSE